VDVSAGAEEQTLEIMITHALDWRDEAIAEALRAEAAYGDGLDALLRQVRSQRVGWATLLLPDDLDRLQLLRALQASTSSFRRLLPGSDGFIEESEVYPYIGWYEVEWEGDTIEVVLAPGRRRGDAVLIGSDAEALRRFARTLEDYAARPAGRCLQYSHGWESALDLDAEVGSVSWDDIVLSPQVLHGVRQAVEGFFHSREAFATLGFAWRRGILLIGPPGTGKTMVCKAAASALPELPFLYVRDVREHREEDAVKTIFKRARTLSPCLLAFEDIDGFVAEHNRTVFLNELDGFRQNDGLLVIASSNHPAKIDEALLKRPSRFDRVFHLGLPALAERREYCRRLLARPTVGERLAASLDREALAQRVAERTEGFTPAFLKEAFLAAALQRAQEGALVLDEAYAEAVLAQAAELREQLRAMRDPEALAEIGSGLAPVGFQPPVRE
jgi:hypothetical protein